MSCGHSWNLADHPEAARLGLGVMALRYASLGYAVLPCERGGKKPHPRLLPESGGVHHATRDPDQIRSWWSLDMAAGIGVATGQVSALAVIDLDIKGEADGRVSLGEWLRSRGSQLPWPAPAARTPSGGMHVWLRTPPGSPVPERPGILPGVDVKGTGGYVLAAPSAKFVVPDGRDGQRVEPVPVPYQWVTSCPCSVPMAPSWLRDWVHSAPERVRDDEALPPLDTEELMKTGVPVGERNHTIYRLACSMYRKVGTDATASAVVLDRIRAIWLAGDITGFSWRELLVCVESARKFIDRQRQQEMMAFAAWKNRG